MDGRQSASQLLFLWLGGDAFLSQNFSGVTSLCIQFGLNAAKHTLPLALPLTWRPDQGCLDAGI